TTVYLHAPISEANRRKVSVFTFYAPSVGLTSFNRLAASYGQSSLNRLADSTGGKAFFQGTTGFVTFHSYFNRLQEALNRQYARASSSGFMRRRQRRRGSPRRRLLCAVVHWRVALPEWKAVLKSTFGS